MEEQKPKMNLRKIIDRGRIKQIEISNEANALLRLTFSEEEKLKEILLSKDGENIVTWSDVYLYPALLNQKNFNQEKFVQTTTTSQLFIDLKGCNTVFNLWYSKGNGCQGFRLTNHNGDEGVVIFCNDNGTVREIKTEPKCTDVKITEIEQKNVPQKVSHYTLTKKNIENLNITVNATQILER